jgi:uncharacterized RDD family membrane protein YckC
MEQNQILDAPIAVDRNLKYAGFWIRVAAIVIDGFVFSGCYVVFGLLLYVGSFQGENSIMTPVVVVVFVACYILYFPLFESSAKQATPGKMAVGIKVGNSKGDRISFGNALGRYFSKILSGMILYVGFMMAGWDPKKQALHDKLADTYVFNA